MWMLTWLQHNTSILWILSCCTVLSAFVNKVLGLILCEIMILLWSLLHNNTPPHTHTPNKEKKKDLPVKKKQTKKTWNYPFNIKYLYKFTSRTFQTQCNSRTFEVLLYLTWGPGKPSNPGCPSLPTEPSLPFWPGRPGNPGLPCRGTFRLRQCRAKFCETCKKKLTSA